jgi:ribosomal protection tetracycline resistance protein
LIQKDIRNIALFAHVDAGKTTVTEQFLHLSGKIKEAGSVDKGNSQTDFLEVEKERGITVSSTVLTFEWKDTKINLIDTPGHIDFSSETEKAIDAIDCAVVIISALEGVQAQTENITNLLLLHRKPFLIFINKTDREGTDTDRVVKEIKNELNLNIVELQKVVNEGSTNVDIELLWHPETLSENTDLMERVIEQDDNLFNKYLDGETPDWNDLNRVLTNCIKKQTLIPVLYGSAKYSSGIEFLLDSIISLLPAPPVLSGELFGIVFKTNHLKGLGKTAAVRLFGGTIISRSSVKNATKNTEEKVSLIKDTDLQNQSIIQSFSAGEIAWIQGLKNAEPGDYIGRLPDNQIKTEKSKALLTVQVIPQNEADINALIDAMSILNNEDPGLQFRYLKEERELHINIRGEIQKEILQSVIKSRFGIEVTFSKPTVIYKETPTVACEGFVRYWMPKPCWAIMKFRIEPGERGSGVQYSSVVSVNDIKQKYQNDVEKAIPFALQQGILGWQVDDIKITLIEGEDHEIHTKSNDFTIATPMGIMEGLTHSEPTLLEPVLSFKISAPEESLGVIVSELIRLRAEFNNPEIEKSQCRITGEIPLATSLDFPVKLSSLTGGKGKIITRFSSYKPCDVSLGKTREYKGISPLDTAKYILKARKALS